MSGTSSSDPWPLLLPEGEEAIRGNAVHMHGLPTSPRSPAAPTFACCIKHSMFQSQGLAGPGKRRLRQGKKMNKLSTGT